MRKIKMTLYWIFSFGLNYVTFWWHTRKKEIHFNNDLQFQVFVQCIAELRTAEERRDQIDNVYFYFISTFKRAYKLNEAYHEVRNLSFILTCTVQFIIKKINQLFYGIFRNIYKWYDDIWWIPNRLTSVTLWMIMHYV